MFALLNGKDENAFAQRIGKNLYPVFPSIVAQDERTEAAIVEAIIDAIGEVELTPACQSRIYAARRAYDALDESIKLLVSNYQKLLATES